MNRMSVGSVSSSPGFSLLESRSFARGGRTFFKEDSQDYDPGWDMGTLGTVDHHSRLIESCSVGPEEVRHVFLNKYIFFHFLIVSRYNIKVTERATETKQRCLV